MEIPIIDVSIIIVNWNLKDYLRSCLDSIEQFGGGLSREIIVVDNASSDGSAEMLTRYYPQVKVILNKENVGFSRANNQAMEIAKGRYYFLFNNDALLYRGALPGLVGFMDAHDEVGICGPRVVNEDGSLQIRSKGRYPSCRTALAHFFLPSFVQSMGSRPLGFYDFLDHMNERPIDWLSGCALLVRREAVVKVGPLNADVFMYCEDVDWCYRMKKAGWQVYYVPEATILHFAGMSMKKQKGKVVGAHKQGLIDFYSKYHSPVKSILFQSVLWVGYGTKALGWAAGALAGHGEGVDKLKRMLRQKKLS